MVRVNLYKNYFVLYYTYNRLKSLYVLQLTKVLVYPTRIDK